MQVAAETVTHQSEDGDQKFYIPRNEKKATTEYSSILWFCCIWEPIFAATSRAKMIGPEPTKPANKSAKHSPKQLANTLEPSLDHSLKVL